MITNEIIERIKVFEGYSEKPYVCPAGKWTIGFGYNYQDRGFKVEDMTEILKNGFGRELAEKLLRQDVLQVVKDCEKNLVWFKELNDVRRATLADMCYQMGFLGLLQFKKMIEAIKKSDFETASKEAKDSKWYAQSGRRSKINVEQLKTGLWQNYK